MQLVSQNTKPVNSLTDLESIWTINKIEPASAIDSTSSAKILGKKFSITKGKIQFLDSIDLSIVKATECNTAKATLKQFPFSKYSKYSLTKDIFPIAKDEKVSIINSLCLNSIFDEFLYVPKSDSILFYRSINSKPIFISASKSIALMVPEKKSSMPVVPEKLSSVNQDLTKEEDIAIANFNFTNLAVEAIKQLEAYRDHVYLDGNRNPIFGYGHLVAPAEYDLLKDKYGYEYYDEGTNQNYFQAPANQPSLTDRNAEVENYLRKDLDIIIKNMRRHIKVGLPQYKIDAIVIYLFWRGSYAGNLLVKEFYDLINAKDDVAVSDFIINKMKKDSAGKDIPFLGGHFIRHRNTAKLYNEAKYHENWLIDN